MATDAPGSTPDTNPPERVVDTLSGLREQIARAGEAGMDVTEDVVNSAVTALNDAREQATNFVGAKLDGLKTEVAQWRLLEAIPTPVKEAVETTQITIEGLYQQFKDNTIPFAQTNIEKGIDAVTKMINTLSDTVNIVQEFLAKHLSNLLPSLMALGIPVPEWLLPKGKGMKELFAALNANDRKFKEGPKDEENMREVAKIHSVLNGKKALADRTSLEIFLTSVVEQANTQTEALTTEDILKSAQEIAKAPSVPAAAPAAAPAAPTAAAPAAPAPAAPAAPAPAPSTAA